MAWEVGMKKWLRRIRGAIGMGLAWAAAWGGAGTIMMLGFLLVTGSRPDAPFPLMFGAFGFVAGVIFSGVLGLVEGRRGLIRCPFHALQHGGRPWGFCSPRPLSWPSPLQGTPRSYGT